MYILYFSINSPGPASLHVSIFDSDSDSAYRVACAVYHLVLEKVSLAEHQESVKGIQPVGHFWP